MKRYNYILFDLDGTLVNTKPGIIDSLRHTFQEFEIDTDTTDVRQFIGPPLMNSLVDIVRIETGKASMMVSEFRRHYVENGVLNASLYDGVVDMLDILRTIGYKLIIATSKPLTFTNILLEYFNIMHYFSYVSASDIAQTFDPKQRIIEVALDKCTIKDFNETVMIGDRGHDVTAAKNIGIAAIGVLYGYGDRKELEEAGADYIVDNIHELTGILTPSLYTTSS